MKQIQNLTLISIILTCCASILISCSASKTSTIESHSLQLNLKKGLNAKYIMNEYSAYNPTNVALSNKTLNEYRATFECTSNKIEEVLAIMKNDNQISSITNNKTGRKIQTSKNEKHAKTGPIKSTNN